VSARYTVKPEWSPSAKRNFWAIYDGETPVQQWTHKPSAIAECKRLNARAALKAAP
jgi:hypothetical protein